MNRYWQNFFTTRFALQRAFPKATLDDIETAIRDGEATHSGEIRFAIETALEVPALIHGVRPRDRALEVFAGLRVWDTAQNNGVLIYVLLAERDIEVVADRGYDGLVAADEWRGVCDDMQTAFMRHAYRDGALAGIVEISAIIRQHFPDKDSDSNELKDRPVLL